MEKLVTAFLIDLIKEHYNHFYELALKSELQHGFSLDLQQYVIIFGTEEQPCRIEISGIELYAFIYNKLVKESKRIHDELYTLDMKIKP